MKANTSGLAQTGAVVRIRIWSDTVIFSLPDPDPTNKRYYHSPAWGRGGGDPSGTNKILFLGDPNSKKSFGSPPVVQTTQKKQLKKMNPPLPGSKKILWGLFQWVYSNIITKSTEVFQKNTIFSSL